REKNVEVKVDPNKLAMPEFKALWDRINGKTVYHVEFDSDELVRKSIDAINERLNVSKVFYRVERGELDEIKSKDALQDGTAFKRLKSNALSGGTTIAPSNARYDVVGKLIASTGLTRRTIIRILRGINRDVFELLKFNPEEFILAAGRIISDEEATAIVEHIKYDTTGDTYGIDIFTDARLRGTLDRNVVETDKHLYDHLLFDSTVEKNFADELEADENVVCYTKLPSGFLISTPIGNYNPDWAIVFREGAVKHIYFVAETKGSMDTMQLRLIESTKIHCAREHFKAIAGSAVRYDVVNSYDELLKMLSK
ncbi:MAG: restriction endonuclease subunit R, partial [Selenomonadaceae bacterium]|nr:restriction endonuclease subunit R [Selenomonadaceae bacterium]